MVRMFWVHHPPTVVFLAFYVLDIQGSLAKATTKVKPAVMQHAHINEISSFGIEVHRFEKKCMAGPAVQA